MTGADPRHCVFPTSISETTMQQEPAMKILQTSNPTQDTKNDVKIRQFQNDINHFLKRGYELFTFETNYDPVDKCFHYTATLTTKQTEQ